MSKDLRSNVDVIHSLIPAVRTTTATGSTVDRQGFYSATVIIIAGAVSGAGSTTPSLLESDESGANFTTVGAGDLIGNFSAITNVANVIQRVGYRGTKRYLRVVGTVSGTHEVAYAGTVVLGHPRHAPVA